MADSSNESERWDDLFVGTKQSHNDFKRAHQIKDTPEEKAAKKESDKTVSQKTVLSKDTLKMLDDESLRILRRTRCANDYNQVFMQSSLDFYDKYYNESNVSPELKAARNIRRMYRSYEDYLKALDIRTAYIDTLVDKYGESEFMKKYQMGILSDWIPPLPILSKSAEDYDLYMAGLSPLMVCETLPEETLTKVLESMQEDLGDIEIVEGCDTETSIGLINEIIDTEDKRDYSVNVSSLEDLAKEFKSWYKSEVAENATERVMFKNAPENIRKRFLDQCAYMAPGLLHRIMNGEDIEETTINMKESVHDDVTGRTMTRQELYNRETIRLFEKAGWSQARLLKYQNIGSSLQRTPRKRKARRKRSGSDEELVSFMNTPEGIDPMYVDNEDLMASLDALMRGD